MLEDLADPADRPFNFLGLPKVKRNSSFEEVETMDRDEVREAMKEKLLVKYQKGKKDISDGLSKNGVKCF